MRKGTNWRLKAFLAFSSYERRGEEQIMCGSMQWLLIGIKDAEDVDGVADIIDGKGDEEGKALHGFAADVFVADG